MSLQIGNIITERGQKKSGMLDTIKNGPELPVTVICGKLEGPTVLISAGVHGAEYSGIQTAMELSREIKPEELRGNLVILLIANPLACYDFVRFVVPEDDKNLNRVFPGKRDGTLAEKTAYAMVHDLMGQADYYIDLHAGDTSERVMPFVYYPGKAEDEVIMKAKDMAAAADMAVRVKSESSTGAYNYAGILGIPSVLLERGGGGVFTREEVGDYKQDVRNILCHMGMTEGNEIHHREQREIKRAVYIEAEKDGFWYPSFQAGGLFKKGELLGGMKDVWGAVLDEWYAQEDGIVLYQTVGMGVKRGDPLIAYGFF